MNKYILKLIYITGLILIFSEKVYANETFLVCSNGSSSITLSYDNYIGREHLGGTNIHYEAIISDASIFLQRKYDGKLFRSWNIDRYSGNATLNWNDKGKIKNSYWNCRKSSKKF